MIRLENLTKTFVMRGRRKTILKNVNVEFPTGRSIALLGRNGAGKSTLLQMIAGAVEPTEGDIISTGSISWPVGYSGSFHRDLSGIQNTKFIARAYGVDTEALVAFVEDFADLGKHFFLPVSTYSSGMKSRLAFGVSMGVKFDTYLVDEVTAVGDANFKAKSRAVFAARMQDAGAIFVSHSMRQVKIMCDAGAVLEDGRLVYFDDLEEAIAFHLRNMGLDSDEDDD